MELIQRRSEKEQKWSNMTGRIERELSRGLRATGESRFDRFFLSFPFILCSRLIKLVHICWDVSRSVVDPFFYTALNK